MIVTVPKITLMIVGMGNITKPKTNSTWWQVVEERATEFVIEILE